MIFWSRVTMAHGSGGSVGGSVVPSHSVELISVFIIETHDLVVCCAIAPLLGSPAIWLKLNNQTQTSGQFCLGPIHFCLDFAKFGVNGLSVPVFRSPNKASCGTSRQAEYDRLTACL